MNKQERYQRNINILKAVQRSPRPTYKDLALEFKMNPSSISRALTSIISEMPVDELDAICRK